MAKPKKVEECRHCGREITRERTPVGLPRYMWWAKTGFYCPQAGGECQHDPK